MNEKEQSISATGLIFKISAITGCQLPTHEAHINALEQELLIFLKEFNGYDSYTNEEILTAFRMNAAYQLDEKVEDYGKVFNVEYIGKVLKLYSKKRHSLEYKLRDALFEQETQDKLLNESMRRRNKIQEQYKKFTENNDAELDLADCYMQLKEDNGFKNKAYHERYLPSSSLPKFNGSSVNSIGDYLKAKIEFGFKAEHQSTLDYFKALYGATKSKTAYTSDWKLIMQHFDKDIEQEEIEPEW